jgi:hypothetical protein
MTNEKRGFRNAEYRWRANPDAEGASLPTSPMRLPSFHQEDKLRRTSAPPGRTAVNTSERQRTPANQRTVSRLERRRRVSGHVSPNDDLLCALFDPLVLLHWRRVPLLSCIVSSCQVAAIRQPDKHHGICPISLSLNDVFRPSGISKRHRSVADPAR